jgi:hypothetical protein
MVLPDKLLLFLEFLKDVTTEILALLILAILTATNVFTLELFAKITTCVPLENVLMEHATFLNKETVTTTTFALKTVATQHLDANTNQPNVQMETNAPLICAQEIEDATTLTNHAMTRTHVLLILAILLLDNVYSLQDLALITMHAPLTAAMFQLETVSTVLKIVMTTMHVLLTLAILQLDALTINSLAMITTCALKTVVMLKLDVSLL